MALMITPRVDQAIRQHGVETYPDECCGALYGSNGSVTDTFALPNVTEEGPRRRFRISDKDYMKTERRASELGAELLGFYHSHPDHPARPSQYDLDHAFPFFWYVIVSIQQAKPEQMTVWRLADDRSQFREESLAGV